MTLNILFHVRCWSLLCSSVNITFVCHERQARATTCNRAQNPCSEGLLRLFLFSTTMKRNGLSGPKRVRGAGARGDLSDVPSVRPCVTGRVWFAPSYSGGTWEGRRLRAHRVSRVRFRRCGPVCRPFPGGPAGPLRSRCYEGGATRSPPTRPPVAWEAGSTNNC